MSVSLRVFILLIICISRHSGAQAQFQTQITGRWEFENFRRISSPDLVSGDKLKTLVGDNAFYDFQDNNKYSSLVNNIFSRGEWKITAANLVLTSAEGKTKTFEIITINKTTLVLLVKGDGYYSFMKNRQIVPAAGAADPNEPKYINPEEIIRKWVLIELHDSLESKIVNEGMTSFVKGGWYDFRSDGYYVKKMISREKTGKWKLTEGNRTLIMVDDDGLGSVWHIGSVTPTRLVLHKPNSTMEHIFMALQ